MTKNKKIIAMIPARAGSKRIPKKNIRYLGNKPLIQYIIDTAKNIEIFDDVYVNSNDSTIEKLSKELNVKYYKRDESLCSDFSTNDEFALDFINNINCDILIQLLPTSPFVTKKEIISFTNEMIEANCDSLISVKNAQIGCVYENTPINFSKTKPNPPSQEMVPVKIYATSIMGWKTNIFKYNMNKYGCAYHGGTGKTKYFTLSGFSTIDIDNEEDFQLAEVALKSFKSTAHKKYYK